MITDIDSLSLFYLNQADGNPWYQDITGFERITGRPNVLCGWLVGEGAVLANNFSDSQLIKTCTSLLHLFCCDQSIPEPDEIYRQVAAEHVFCSYCGYIHAGCVIYSNCGYALADHVFCG